MMLFAAAPWLGPCCGSGTAVVVDRELVRRWIAGDGSVCLERME